MIAILRKELADYFTSIRFIVLFLLVLLASAAGLYAAFQGIRQALTQSDAVMGRGFVFLALFTSSGDTLPSLIFFISLFVPIIGIALGFDAVNSERSSGTLSRILSQPVFRDSVINGKFLAGMVTMTIMVTTTLLIVSGYGLRMIGVAPSAEEIIRLFIYLVLTIVFGAFWMCLGVLFSTLFRRVAASLLISIAVWLVFSFFMPILVPAIANSIAPTTSGTDAALIHNAEVQQTLLRFSPDILYMEATTVLLLPVVRSLGIITMTQASNMLPNPLSLGQSLILVWPHIVTLISLSTVLFAITYIIFMKQEIRPT